VGQNPALLVAVPAGIVLCGGAIAVSKWFDQHRDEDTVKIFRLKQRKTPVRRVSVFCLRKKTLNSPLNWTAAR